MEMHGAHVAEQHSPAHLQAVGGLLGPLRHAASPGNTASARGGLADGKGLGEMARGLRVVALLEVEISQVGHGLDDAVGVLGSTGGFQGSYVVGSRIAIV